MNQHTSLRTTGSLIERAADIYGFGTTLRAPAPQPEPQPEAEPVEVALEPAEIPASEDTKAARKRPVMLSDEDFFFDEPVEEVAEAEEEPLELLRSPTGPGAVDRDALREAGFILPDAPVSGLAEEFRIIKRQLLQAASGKTGIADDKRQTIMVCSAAPNEGKTFCAVNLALSMASEPDLEVLLVDGDFAKPEILSILGLEGGAGLTDAIADPRLDVEGLVIRTDIERLSVLPAGRQLNNVTELLASRRTRDVLDALTKPHPKRIVIFDSPPTLMASPATILASKVGQIVMVVRADTTKEADLREAVGLLSACEHLSLMLNGAGFAATGRRFGSYYGYSQ